MTEIEIYDGVIMNGTTDFAFVVETLRRHGARWCVIGGLAVNTYAEPVYTADLDMVVIAEDLGPVLDDLRAADFRVKEFPFSVNAQRRAGPRETAASKLMVQFTKPGKYQAFVERAVIRPVFGFDVPVAALPDVVQGKLWAWGQTGPHAIGGILAGGSRAVAADGSARRSHRQPNFPPPATERRLGRLTAPRLRIPASAG